MHPQKDAGGRQHLRHHKVRRTVSDALNPNMEAQGTQCILNRTPADTINGTLGIIGTGTGTVSIF